MDYDETKFMNQTIIKCQNLSHYYSGKAALDNISFDIQAGDPIGLVGPNGAGKTTLFNVFCGYLRPSSGNVTLFDHKPGASELNGKISALPQDAKLDPSFTIGEQLGFFARLQGLSTSAAKAEAIRVLDAVSLKDSFHQKPAVLSHGMGKRVAIAQALIGKPELIFFDEPTAGLDPVNTRNIRSIISEHAPETTFIISSHDLTELGRLCQQVLLLDKGIMSKTNQDNSDTTSSSQFFTLQLESYPAEDVIEKLRNLTGVIQVTNPQKNEFIMEYNAEVESKMDVKIMVCLTENNWQYRQLSRGKTLEEKLFF